MDICLRSGFFLIFLSSSRKYYSGAQESASMIVSIISSYGIINSSK